MSEENNNAGMSESASAPDDTKKLSEDARGLGPRHAGPFAIGVVDEIVGEGGVEVPGFVATKNEILQLVRYWATEILDLDFDYFLTGCTGSSEWRTSEFANRRLNTSRKFIGDEEAAKAFMQAEQAFGQRVDQRAWKIFMEGTTEEQEAFRWEILASDAQDGGLGRLVATNRTHLPNGVSALMLPLAGRGLFAAVTPKTRKIATSQRHDYES